MSISFKQKMSLREAQELVTDLVELVRPVVDSYQICGSIRRQKSEVGDIDLVISGSLGNLMGIPGLVWLEGGAKKATLSFRGQQVNVLRSSDERWGAAILYFTGPHDYNIGMRRLAKSRGLKLNENGLWRGEVCLASRTEAQIYDALGKSYKDPWMRGK